MTGELRQQFESAGWYEGRRVAVREALDALRSADYEVWPDLERFLEEFNGLSITVSFRTEPLWIDPVRAVGFLDRDWTDAYAERAGVALVPVGGYSHLTILLGTDGFYGGYDANFGRLGRTLFEVVDSTINPQHPAPLDLNLED